MRKRDFRIDMILLIILSIILAIEIYQKNCFLIVTLILIGNELYSLIKAIIKK